jgi:RNA:NAD 2'-phosphotransferase (TPT1/KptA family)
MTAFDTAWDLMKAPYHGTTSDALPSIRRRGLQPRSPDPFTPPLVFYTNTPEQAMSFAKIRAEEKGRGDPVLLQFPKSAVENNKGEHPAQEWGYQTSTKTIPWEMLQVIEGPRKPKQDILWEDEPYDKWSDQIEEWKKIVRRYHDEGMIE